MVPVSVTGTVAPCAPLFGLMEVRVGAAGVTAKVTALLVPPEVVTVTLAVPRAAVGAILKSAVIWVELITLTLLTVTPELLTFTVAGETKLVPVSVTGTVAPCAPLVGLVEVRVGAAEVTAKVTAKLVPPERDTVT